MEQVRDLAAGVPVVPETAKAVLGRVRLDRVFAAPVDLRHRRLEGEVLLDELGDDDQPRTVRQPPGIVDAEREVRDPLWLAAVQTKDVELRSRVLIVGRFPRERESFSVG